MSRTVQFAGAGVGGGPGLGGPFSYRAVIPCCGVMIYSGTTLPEPPPCTVTPLAPFAPVMAIFFTFVTSIGSKLFSFLRSTVAAAAIVRATLEFAALPELRVWLPLFTQWS